MLTPMPHGVAPTLAGAPIPAAYGSLTHKTLHLEY